MYKSHISKKLTPEHCANIAKSRVGMKLSPQHCAAISKALKGNPKVIEAQKWNKNGHGNLGKKRQDMIGNTYASGNLGKPLTLEHCANIAAAMKGKKLTLEHRKAISKGLTGKKFTSERRKAISEALTGRKHTPEHNANMRLGVRLAMTPKVCAAISRAMVGNSNGLRNTAYAPNLGHYYRQGWELDVCTFLKESEILYRYEATKFVLGSHKDRTWTPDIEFNSQLYLEIKGYLTKEASWQIPRFLREYPDRTLILLAGPQAIQKLKKYSFANVTFLLYDKEKEWQPKLLEILKTKGVTTCRNLDSLAA